MKRPRRERPAARGIACFLFGTVLCLCVPGPLRAESSVVQTLPVFTPARPGRPPPPTPWRIQVDPSGVGGQAYRGVEITVTEFTNTPLTADHSLRVILRPNHYGSGAYDEQVTGFIEIPEGSSTATAIIDVPQRQQWNSLHVEFHEDGERLEGYTATLGVPRMSYRPAGDDSASVLVIDRDAPTRDEYRAIMATITSPGPNIKDKHNLPDVRWLAAAIPSNLVATNNQNLVYAAGENDDAQLLQTFSAHEGVDIIPPQEVAQRWLSISNADLAVISLDDLQHLKDTQPDGFEALLRWATAGGSLMVYGCGDKWDRLGPLCAIVGLPQSGSPGDKATPWRLPTIGDFQAEVRGVFDNNNATYTYAVQNPDGTTTMQNGRPSGEKSKWTEPPFTWRPLGLGRLVVYRSDNPFPGVPGDWGGLWNSLGSSQFLWSRRHGMSHHRQNPDFWNFVIPGVGEAPVFSFMTMIALFMLLIGPVNYYYLNRWRRLSLLLVTVPVGAGIFTFGLFVFAVLSDGFTTRSRVRSFTIIEPTAARAATISRQTYYTAFVPSSGMHYPADTAVYPLHYAPYNETVHGHFFNSDSQWLDGKLQLQRRYLTARQHRQFLTVRSTGTKARLDVTASGGSLSVKNQLGSKIDFGLLIDSAGKLHSVENLGDGATVTAQPVDVPVARKEWSARTTTKAPRLPLNFNPERYNSMFSSQRYYNYGWRGGSAWNPTQTTGMLESGIREVDTLLMRLPERTTGSVSTLGVGRTFVALTADSVLGDDGEAMAPMGVPDSRVVESLHVVRGSW